MDRHHILEIITTKDGSDGDYGTIIINGRERLKELGLYGDRKKKNFGLPSWMICECTSAEHHKLHGKFRSDEHKRKLSKVNTGKKLSEETKHKIGDSIKGKTTSLFGRKFKEHFGITHNEDRKLYMKEYNFYKTHGYFRWENEQISIAS